MNLPICATLTRCRHQQPLVVLQSEPVNGMELRSYELRQMAQQLSALADLATGLPVGDKNFRPTTVVVGAAGAPCANPLDKVIKGMTKHLKEISA